MNRFVQNVEYANKERQEPLDKTGYQKHILPKLPLPELDSDMACVHYMKILNADQYGNLSDLMAELHALKHALRKARPEDVTEAWNLIQTRQVM